MRFFLDLVFIVVLFPWVFLFFLTFLFFFVFLFELSFLFLTICWGGTFLIFLVNCFFYFFVLFFWFRVSFWIVGLFFLEGLFLFFWVVFLERIATFRSGPVVAQGSLMIIGFILRITGDMKMWYILLKFELSHCFPNTWERCEPRTLGL